MYAIIEDSGTQIMVREGDVIEVDLRQESPEAGSNLVFDRVLAVGGGDGDANIDTPYIGGASVDICITRNSSSLRRAKQGSKWQTQALRLNVSHCLF